MKAVHGLAALIQCE